MNWEEGGTQGFTPEDALKEERDYLEANKSLLWHPFTEEPEEEGQYLVQHYYKTWSGKIIITFELADSLEDLMNLTYFVMKHGNRDNHYQAWQKIEPYEEEENDI